MPAAWVSPGATIAGYRLLQGCRLEKGKWRCQLGPSWRLVPSDCDQALLPDSPLLPSALRCEVSACDMHAHCPTEGSSEQQLLSSDLWGSCSGGSLLPARCLSTASAALGGWGAGRDPALLPCMGLWAAAFQTVPRAPGHLRGPDLRQTPGLGWAVTHEHLPSSNWATRSPDPGAVGRRASATPSAVGGMDALEDTKAL